MTSQHTAQGVTAPWKRCRGFGAPCWDSYAPHCGQTRSLREGDTLALPVITVPHRHTVPTGI